MERRKFLKAACSMATLPFLSDFCMANTSVKKQIPNVMIIVTDDQYEFGFLSSKPTTPHIDKLVKEGKYFSRAYTTAACTPARYNILTGKYACRSKCERMMSFVSKEGQYNIQWNTSLNINDEPHNMANIFQSNGYFTGHVGKHHNNITSNDPNIRSLLNQSLKKIDPDAPLGDPENNKRLKQAQYALQKTMKTNGYDYAAAVVDANLDNFIYKPLAAHNQEWMTKGAYDFLDLAKEKDKPFFLYMATTLTHGPNAKRNSLDDDPRKTPEGYLDSPIDGYQPSREDVKRRSSKIDNGRYGSTTWLDDSVGAVMHKLKEIGADENTIVIFMTDHAVWGGKASCYEGGVNPPVAIRWKNTFQPSESKALIHTVDFLPTLIDLCKLKTPENLFMDGTDISSLLTDKAEKVREHVYLEWGATRAIVTEKYKYIALRHLESVISREEHEMQVEEFMRFFNKNNFNIRKVLSNEQLKNDILFPYDHGGNYSFKGPMGTLKQPIGEHFYTIYDYDQLFDLEKDPKEKKNLAKLSEYQGVLKQMQGLLKQELQDKPGSFAEFKTISEEERRKWEENFKEDAHPRLFPFERKEKYLNKRIQLISATESNPVLLTG